MYSDNYYQNEEFFKNLKKREEKKQIKDVSKYIGIAFLILTAISLLWTVVFMAGAARFGLSYETVMELLEEPAVMQAAQIIIPLIAFTLPFLIVTSNSSARFKDIVRLGKPDKELLLPLTLVGLGMCAFGNVCVNVITKLFNVAGIELSAPEMERPEGIFGFILVILSTAVVPALAEEFALRGVVLGALRKFGDGFAIITSSILFGLMHGNFVQMPFAFVVGLGIGYAVVKTGSVWTGVLIHFLNNFFSVVLNEIMSFTESVFIKNSIGTMYYAVTFLCFFIGLLIMKNKKGSDFSLTETQMTLTTSGRVGAVFSAAPIIVFVIAVALEGLLFM